MVFRSDEVTASLNLGSSVLLENGVTWIVLEPAGMPLVDPSRYPAHPAQSTPNTMLHRPARILLPGYPALDRIDALSRGVRVRRAGILEEHFVVVNERS